MSKIQESDILGLKGLTFESIGLRGVAVREPTPPPPPQTHVTIYPKENVTTYPDRTF